MDRYEKALELARAYYDKDGNAFLDTIFPELKESRDKQIWKAIIKSLDMPFPEDNLPGMDITYEEAVAWLEKQKDREWSEEDEKNLELIIDCIYTFYPDPVMKYKLKDWLKSLRPSWKPSEEDIKMLEHIIGQYETGNKNSEVVGYLPRVEELSFLKNVLSKWKN